MATKTYREGDLQALEGVISWARGMWAKRCAEYVAKHGDTGSCVIGAGIMVNLLPPRCRRARKHRILDVPATAGQGSLTWEDSVEDVLRFLRDRDLDAWYDPGRVD